MGNGESTARRISMQKTEEGSVQISEEVLWRLKKNKEGRDTISDQEENKIKIKEENLKLLLKDAYEKGKQVGEAEASKNYENDADRNLGQRSQGIEELENAKNMEIDSLQQRMEEAQSLSKSQLEDKEKLLQDSDRKLSELMKEREEYQKKLETKEESLKVEFQRGVEDIRKIIRPLQEKTTLCEQLQQDVIDCYSSNRQHPLRCSKIVDEFRQCVNEARLKQMDSNES